MSRVETIAGALKGIVEIIVTLPKHVEVTTKTAGDTGTKEVTCFDISVHDSDRGRLLGKAGANMRALRVLLNSAAYVVGTRYRVTCDGVSHEDQL